MSESQRAEQKLRDCLFKSDWQKDASKILVLNDYALGWGRGIDSQSALFAEMREALEKLVKYQKNLGRWCFMCDEDAEEGHDVGCPIPVCEAVLRKVSERCPK